MRKLFIYLGIALFIANISPKQVDAQTLNGAYKKNDIINKKPVPLPVVREADVLWSKTLWRVIDLREKMNIPLYYPTVDIDGRINLINLLLEGIENGQITPYDARTDDDFKIPLSFTQVKEIFGATASTQEKINFDTGEKEIVTVSGEIRPEEIKQFMVKEEWYFDKQTSALHVRILGVCPIREYMREGDTSGLPQRQKVFWVYYPEARPLLATNLIMNPYNDALQLSFDDVFIKRMFSSYITKESNMYNNRDVSTYLKGKQAMLESKQIEDDIFTYEQDLWEY